MMAQEPLQQVQLQPFGDAAVRAVWPAAIDPDISVAVHNLAQRLHDQQLSGIVDIVPAYAAVTVHFDPLLQSTIAVCTWIEQVLRGPASPLRARLWTLPVAYGGAHGPDLVDVAAHLGLTPQAVVDLHTGHDFLVYMLGFAPGFAYLGALPPALHLPRRATPRPAVPAGAVLLAGAQTAVLPQVLPSGWHQIGWTPAPMLQWSSDPPTLLQPGDRVRFVSITALQAARLAASGWRPQPTCEAGHA